MNAPMDNWNNANQHYLMAALAVVREQLETYKAQQNGDKETVATSDARLANALKKMEEAAAVLPAVAALDNLVNTFGLSSFERSVLLMCAGVELDSSFASLIAGLQSNPNAFLPSFSLALAAIKDAHWSALSPHAPLRYWRLVEANTNQLISKAPLRIDEHILHYLAGVQQPDEKLEGTIEPFYTEVGLVPSHLELSDRILAVVSEKLTHTSFAVVTLTGVNKVDKDSIAAYVSSQMGMYPYVISVNAIPSVAKDVLELARAWNREAALRSRALLIDYAEMDTSDKVRVQLINNFIENIHGLVIINCGQALPKLSRRQITYEVGKPTSEEQLILWKKGIGEEKNIPDQELGRLVAQFNLSAKTIYQAGVELTGTYFNGSGPEEVMNQVWKTCCRHARPDVGELAQHIGPIATMDDLVLPDAQKEILKELIIHVRQRPRVYGEWGFGRRSNRGLGITALFAGESGTGKTMASEVLANALNLDLYRIDLSQVINKYIGETEKNLKRIFDAAEDGGAILLFDEADALFGKRSEVKDSHDRYANIEISYLLQRMEAYRGLAILTTNMKHTMDKAWTRRLRFIVQFPFPDLVQRAEIWKRIFPSDTPTDNLDIEKLARFNIAGGNIRNIALNAAFIAAHEGSSVNMSHVQRALRSEYNKMEKPMTTMETGGMK
jgi:AAA+ superfamily predicted ATPase